MTPSRLALVATIGLSVAAPGARAWAQAEVTNSGSALAAGVQGTGLGAELIERNQAADNLPAAASSMATSFNGFRQPITANEAPGTDRFALDNEPDKLVTSNGEIRVRLLLGHQLYSTTGRQIGLVVDVLIMPGEMPQLIVQAEHHLVAVPWNRLYFGLPGAMLHGSPVLPGGTRRELNTLPAFSFTALK